MVDLNHYQKLEKVGEGEYLGIGSGCMLVWDRRDVQLERFVYGHCCQYDVWLECLLTCEEAVEELGCDDEDLSCVAHGVER
jgi:hypothetical protein